MLRTILTTGAAMLLSLAFLAACETDTTDDAGSGDDSEDVEETTSPDDEDTEESATEEDDEDTEETATEEDDEDAEETATDEDDEDAATPEDSEDADGDDDSASGEAVQVTLSDFEIDVESPLPSGEVVLEVTNESDGLHGLAIERSSGSDSGDDEDAEGSEDSDDEGSTEDSDDDGDGAEDSDEGENGDDEDSTEFIDAINVDAGETRELEVELEAGEYTFYSPLGELRESEGMETDVTVE